MAIQRILIVLLDGVIAEVDGAELERMMGSVPQRTTPMQWITVLDLDTGAVGSNPDEP